MLAYFLVLLFYVCFFNFWVFGGLGWTENVAGLFTYGLVYLFFGSLVGWWA